MFESHYHETLPEKVLELYASLDTKDARKRFKQELKEANITWDGKKPIPVSFYPRILPLQYKQTIEDAARLITETILSSYHDRDSLMTEGLNQMLIEEFNVLERMPKKITGSARYDFAITGEPTPNNPPRLLELNMLDYGGIGWVPGINRAILKTIKGLSELVTDTDLNNNFISNLKKMGNRMLFIYEDDLSYADYSNFYYDAKGIEIVPLSNIKFLEMLKNGNVKLSPEGAYVIKDRGYKTDFIYLRSFSTYNDIINSKEAVKAIIDSKVPMYDGFASLLLENKSILSLFRKKCKNKNLAEKFFLNSEQLNQELKQKLLKNPEGIALKYSDSHFGENVYIGKEIKKQLARINDYNGWCVQDFTKLNTSEIWQLNQEKFSGIVDLAVYVNYTLEKGNLQDFSVAGYLCRSSKKDFKVNVSRGGCFVPVFFTK